VLKAVTKEQPYKWRPISIIKSQGLLTEVESMELLEKAGISVIETRLAQSKAAKTRNSAQCKCLALVAYWRKC